MSQRVDIDVLLKSLRNDGAHTTECLINAARTRRSFCIVKCADRWRPLIDPDAMTAPAPTTSNLTAEAEAEQFFRWMDNRTKTEKMTALTGMVERIRRETADIVGEGRAEMFAEMEALRIENDRLKSEGLAKVRIAGNGLCDVESIIIGGRKFVPEVPKVPSTDPFGPPNLGVDDTEGKNRR